MSEYAGWILYLLRGNRRIVAGICILLAASPLMNGLLFRLNQHFFDELGTLARYETVMLIVGGLFGIRLLEVVAVRLQGYIQELLSINLEKKLEAFTFSLTDTDTLNLRETPDYQNDLNVLVQNLRKTNQLVIAAITQVRELLVVIVYAYLLCGYHWGVLFVVVSLSIPSLVYVVMHAIKLDRFFVAISQAEMEKGNLTSILLQPPAQKETLVFRAGAFFIRKWLKAYDKVLTEKRTYMRSELKWGLGADLVIPFKFLLVQAILLPLLYRGHLGFGDYMAISSAVVPLDNSLRTLITSFDVYANLKRFTVRLKAFKTKYVISASADNAAAIPGLSEIAVRNLVFYYPNQPAPALRHIDLEIRSGEVIALIGENGSGKSTLAKVIAGLYAVPPGTLALNRNWIERISRDSVHRQVAIVAQDFARLPLSVFENIALEEPDERNRIRMAEFLAKYPELVPEDLKDDLNQVIGNSYLDARQLSGGQWQRIALARALYKNSDCLVLDEATSEIDPAAEMAIMCKVAEERRRNRQITVIVTHHVHLAYLADRIYVMHNGSIIERGSPAELDVPGSKFRQVVQVHAQLREEMLSRESKAFV